MRAAMASAGDESPGGDGTRNRDGRHAPLGAGAREPTPWFDRIEPGANDPRTWHDRAMGDDNSLGSTETSYEIRGALIKVAIWCLTIMRDALRDIERRMPREREDQSPV